MGYEWTKRLARLAAGRQELLRLNRHRSLRVANYRNERNPRWPHYFINVRSAA